MARLLLLAVLVVVSGCGGTPSGPSPPVTPVARSEPAKPANDTVWVGSRTLTSASGGECVAAAFAALVGSTGRYELRVTQSGNSLKAYVSDPRLGFVWNYAGTADGSSMSLTPVQFYTPGPFPVRNVRCDTGEGVRDLELDNSTITATVNGDTVTGAIVDEFDVCIVEPAGLGWHYTYVGELVLTSTFALTR
jgi:hypothetical protein